MDKIKGLMINCLCSLNCSGTCCLYVRVGWAGDRCRATPKMIYKAEKMLLKKGTRRWITSYTITMTISHMCCYYYLFQYEYDHISVILTKRAKRKITCSHHQLFQQQQTMQVKLYRLIHLFLLIFIQFIVFLLKLKIF